MGFSEKHARVQLEHGDPSEMLDEVRRLFNASDRYIPAYKPLKRAWQLADQIVKASEKEEGENLLATELAFLLRVYGRILHNLFLSGHMQTKGVDLQSALMKLYDRIKKVAPIPIEYRVRMLRPSEAQLALLIAKGVLVELDRRGVPCVDDASIMEMAEDVQRFLYRFEKDERLKEEVTLLEANMDGESPAIRKARHLSAYFS